ncbi:conserved protein, unknown function [Hepatocystis sp. ex Piliocolobus tephrosceles]|nr:conserved protein, unknown function [Hepatocystis sp. ex Piliocolobus tephrosceles]
MTTYITNNIIKKNSFTLFVCTVCLYCLFVLFVYTPDLFVYIAYLFVYLNCLFVCLHSHCLFVSLHRLHYLPNFLHVHYFFVFLHLQTQYIPHQSDNSPKYISGVLLENIKLNCPNCKKKACKRSTDMCDCLKNKSDISNKNKIPPQYKAHNILKNTEKNIQIHQHIPSISSEIENYLYSNNQKTKSSHNIPEKMNYSGYNNHLSHMNRYGYNYNHNNENMYNTDLFLKQHNLHGKNNLMFENGNIPYGLYDQSNFTGNNSLICGNNVSPYEHPAHMYNKVETNDMLYYNNPMMYGNGMSYKHPMMPRPSCNLHMHKNMINPNYLYETRYMNSTYKNVEPQKFEKKKETSHRRNTSKVRKGDIDINVETGSSNRKGNDHINFSASYHKIAGENNYKNLDLNKVIANSIYESIQNNINYLKKVNKAKKYFFTIFIHAFYIVKVFMTTYITNNFIKKNSFALFVRLHCLFVCLFTLLVCVFVYIACLCVCLNCLFVCLLKLLVCVFA